MFGLAHLLGFQFAPRLPNLADHRLWVFGAASAWPSLIAGRPDKKMIAAHWDDVLRLACSARTGVVSASLMMKRVGTTPGQSGLAIAQGEVGRSERTLHTLNWLSSHPSGGRRQRP